MHLYPNVEAPENTPTCPSIADSTAHHALGGLNAVTISPIVAAGDILLFITGADGASEATGTTWTAPTGATQVGSFPHLAGNGWGPFINVWKKTAINGDAGVQYTFGKTGSEAQTSFAVIIKDATTVAFGNAASNGTALSGNAGSANMGSSTFVTCGLSIIFGFAQNDQQLLPVPNQPDYTQIEQTYPSYRGGSLGVRVFNGPGTTGDRDWIVGTVGNNAISVAGVVVT